MHLQKAGQRFGLSFWTLVQFGKEVIRPFLKYKKASKNLMPFSLVQE